MTGDTEHDPAISDPLSPLHDPDYEDKQYVADALSVHNIGDPVRREVRVTQRASDACDSPFPPLPPLPTLPCAQLSERFAKSGVNFSLLFCEPLWRSGCRGANPRAICRLFTASEALGGASPMERALGALAWQKDDPTFKLSGDNGRIWWKDSCTGERA